MKKLEMERQNTVVFFLVLCLFLVSCVESTKDKDTYAFWGIAQTEPSRYVYMADSSLITSSYLEQIADFKTGDCFFIEYRADYSSNNKKDIIEVDILECDPITFLPLQTKLTDTTEILKNGQFFTVNFKKSLYLKERYFLQTTHTGYMQEQTDFFDLSYSADHVIEEDSLGRRIYELFLRSTKELPKDSTDIISTSRYRTNAINLTDFIEKTSTLETAAGKDSIVFRFNYPSGFNSDTTRVTWSMTDTVRLNIADLRK